MLGWGQFFSKGLPCFRLKICPQRSLLRESQITPTCDAVHHAHVSTTSIFAYVMFLKPVNHGIVMQPKIDFLVDLVLGMFVLGLQGSYTGIVQQELSSRGSSKRQSRSSSKVLFVLSSQGDVQMHLASQRKKFVFGRRTHLAWMQQAYWYGPVMLARNGLVLLHLLCTETETMN